MDCRQIPNLYEPYENFDAIEVPEVRLIPSDYAGAMGVPITFMDKYDPSVFVILDLADKPVVNGKALYKRLIIMFRWAYELAQLGEVPRYMGRITRETQPGIF